MWLLGALMTVGACTKGHTKADEDLYATSRSGGDRGPNTQRSNDAQPTASAWPTSLERWSSLTHDLATSLKGAGSCVEVAKAMRAFTSKNGSELAGLQRQLVEWEQVTSAKEVVRFYRGVQGDMNVRIDAGIRCKDDATARSAYDQFFKVAGLDLR